MKEGQVKFEKSYRNPTTADAHFWVRPTSISSDSWFYAEGFLVQAPLTWPEDIPTASLLCQPMCAARVFTLPRVALDPWQVGGDGYISSSFFVLNWHSPEMGSRQFSKGPWQESANNSLINASSLYWLSSLLGLISLIPHQYFMGPSLK